MYASQARTNTKYTDWLIRSYDDPLLKNVIETATNPIISTTKVDIEPPPNNVHSNNNNSFVHKNSYVDQKVIVPLDSSPHDENTIPSLNGGISSKINPSNKTKFSEIFDSNESHALRLKLLREAEIVGGGRGKVFSDSDILLLHNKVNEYLQHPRIGGTFSANSQANRTNVNHHEPSGGSGGDNSQSGTSDLDKDLQRLNEETLRVLSRTKSSSSPKLNDEQDDSTSLPAAFHHQPPLNHVSYQEILRAEHVALRRELLNNIREISRATFYEDLYTGKIQPGDLNNNDNNNAVPPNNNGSSSRTDSAFHFNLQPGPGTAERVDLWIKNSQEHLNTLGLEQNEASQEAGQPKEEDQQSRHEEQAREPEQKGSASSQTQQLHASLFHDSVWAEENENEHELENEQEPEHVLPNANYTSNLVQQSHSNLNSSASQHAESNNIVDLNNSLRAEEVTRPEESVGAIIASGNNLDRSAENPVVIHNNIVIHNYDSEKVEVGSPPLTLLLAQSQNHSHPEAQVHQLQNGQESDSSPAPVELTEESLHANDNNIDGTASKNVIFPTTKYSSSNHNESTTNDDEASQNRQTNLVVLPPVSHSRPASSSSASDLHVRETHEEVDFDLGSDSNNLNIEDNVNLIPSTTTKYLDYSSRLKNSNGNNNASNSRRTRSNSASHVSDVHESPQYYEDDFHEEEEEHNFHRRPTSANPSVVSGNILIIPQVTREKFPNSIYKPKIKYKKLEGKIKQKKMSNNASSKSLAVQKSVEKVASKSSSNMIKNKSNRPVKVVAKPLKIVDKPQPVVAAASTRFSKPSDPPRKTFHGGVIRSNNNNASTNENISHDTDDDTSKIKKKDKTSNANYYVHETFKKNVNANNGHTNKNAVKKVNAAGLHVIQVENTIHQQLQQGYVKNPKGSKGKVPGILRRHNMDMWVAKKVWFFINGDEHHPKFEYRFRPKRDVKDLDALCDILSNRLKLARGVRYVFTIDGDRVERLDDLKHEHYYVVSSTKKFKVISQFHFEGSRPNFQNLIKPTKLLSSSLPALSVI